MEVAINSKNIHRKQQKKFLSTLTTLVGLLLLVAFVSTFLGPATTFTDSLAKAFSGEATLIRDLVYTIRLPRVLLGLIAGGGLAIAGASLQVLFNNPLADSGLIGISSGAMLGVIVGILFGKVLPPLNFLLENYPLLFLPVLAFAGACFLGFLVYRLSLTNGRVQVAIMLLAGVAINAFAGAFSGLMITLANDEQLRTITFWSMGSLNGATWPIVLSLGLIVAVASFLLLKCNKELDALALGEREALFLGVDTDQVKKRVLILSALICGPVTAFTGMIGFVGLVVPHILRLVLGPKSFSLLICSFLLGGVFLILSDTFAKNIIAPSELPIGIITAMVGTPFFTYLLLKQKRHLS